MEIGASAVLQAFGQPNQPATKAVDALQVVMSRWDEQMLGMSNQGTFTLGQRCSFTITLRHIVDDVCAKFKDLESAPIADPSKAQTRIAELEAEVTAFKSSIEQHRQHMRDEKNAHFRTAAEATNARAKVVELEAENKALREAAAPKPYRYNPGPSFGDLCDPDFVASEGDRHNEEEL